MDKCLEISIFILYRVTGGEVITLEWIVREGLFRKVDVLVQTYKMREARQQRN